MAQLAPKELAMLESKKNPKSVFGDFEKKIIDKPQKPLMPEISLITTGGSSPSDKAGFSALYGHVFRMSLENGKSPFLPDANNIIDFYPAYNIRRNQMIDGVSQIILKEKQSELGFPSAAFVSARSVSKAQKAGIDCAVKKNETGVDIPVSSSEEGTEIIRWFNIGQIQNPENLINYFNKKIEIDRMQRQTYLNRNRPGSFAVKPSLPFNRPKNEIRVFNGNNRSPAEYIAQVLSASMNGIRLEVDKATADKFVKDTSSLLTADYAPGRMNKFALFDLAKKVTAYEKLYSTAIIAERKQHRGQPYERER